jgi:lysyl endopeptidase
MRILLITLLLVLPFAARAYTPELASLPTVAQRHLDATAVQTAIDAAASQPLQFAVGADVGATAADGSWDEPEAGVARWRLRIGSDGAQSLSLRIDALSLPQGAVLYLYGVDGHDVQGPFTAADNGTLWSPLVRADEAVLEARMPYDEKSQFALTIGRAFHGYRAFRAQNAVIAKGAFGDSGDCEVDVACPTGDNWRKQIRAAVLLEIANRFLCSGTLVNNSAQDDRPLILTANHCEISSSNVTATKAYFNVEKSSCGASADGPVNEVLYGKTVLAKTSGSTVTDYTLFELAQTPPDSYDVYYAGWDVGSVAPQSGAVIHHPSGDDKKISTYTQAAQATDDVCIGPGALCLGGFRIDAWAVQWAQGTTEEGSSGSALLNQDGRIVGTLSGGNGACSGGANNGATDYFARLDRAWTASSATGISLRSALDPDGGNTTTLDGRNGNGDSGSSGGGSLGWLTLLPLALASLRRRRR